MEIQQSMFRSYHAFAKSHPLISVTFSTPTECYRQLGRTDGRDRNCRWGRTALVEGLGQPSQNFGFL